MTNTVYVKFPEGFKVRCSFVLEYAETSFTVEDIADSILLVMSSDPSLTMTQEMRCLMDGTVMVALSVAAGHDGPVIVLRPVIDGVVNVEGFHSDHRIIRFALYVLASDKSSPEGTKRETGRFALSLGNIMSSALAR